MPWVIKDGQRKKFRAWIDGMPAWVDDIDDALQLTRRRDAEALAQEDDDAWFVTKIRDNELPK